VVFIWRGAGGEAFVPYSFFFEERIPNQQSSIKNPKSSIPNSHFHGILRPALHSFHSERTFQGIVLITTEACPTETRSGFFVARRGASARKPPL
jgi:hypothetical protein